MQLGTRHILSCLSSTHKHGDSAEARATWGNPTEQHSLSEGKPSLGAEEQMLAASLMKCSNIVFFPLSTGHYYCFSFVACARYKKRAGGSKKKHVFPRLQFLPIKRTFLKSYSDIQNTIYPALKVEAFSPVEEKNLKDHQAYSFFRTPLAVYNTTVL